MQRNGLKWCALRRDKYICQDPSKEGCHETADTVDHIVDHRGDKKLFSTTLTTASQLQKSCHDRKTGEEHGFNRKPKPAPHVVNGVIQDN